MNTFLASCEILPFDETDAIYCGSLRENLNTAGKLIGPYDLMIVAQGAARGLTVATHNTAELSRVPGIRLEDWMV